MFDGALFLGALALLVWTQLRVIARREHLDARWSWTLLGRDVPAGEGEISHRAVYTVLMYGCAAAAALLVFGSVAA
ncbi:unannotated protein [freshwater metagenome]|jgi:hypothetical protein|uniref:Unannotated protein n=1 Tax=freshwater metagenome TaxID=449393 RepID=A0A6J6UGX3_9ZZZZ